MLPKAHVVKKKISFHVAYGINLFRAISENKPLSLFFGSFLLKEK